MLWRLVAMFVRYDDSHDHRGEFRLTSPFDVTLSDHNTLQPDVLYVGADRMHLSNPFRLTGPPSLAVEILSPSDTTDPYCELV